MKGACALGLCALLACGVDPPKLDVTSPKVVSISPADGAVGVSLLGQVTVCLDRQMDPTTVTSDDVSLNRDDGHQVVALASTVTLSPDATCITVSPWSPLAPSSHYRLLLEKGLLSVGGLAISSKTIQFTSRFATAAPPALTAMLTPLEGMLSAPLDLSRVLLWFSAPVSLSDGGEPFSLGPFGGPATLSADGRLASAPFLGAPNGAEIHVTLAPDLVDPSGQTPLTSGPLGFTMGGCPENGSPSLGEGLVLTRDRDAILTFAVDRPSLCGAEVIDQACPDAGSSMVPAQCQVPYDPCQASLLCLCTLPLVGLCPGDAVAVVPAATGFNGRIGFAPAITFAASPALPGLVLTEIRGGSRSGAFVEVQNRSGGPLELLGVALADCGLTLGCSAPKSTELFGPFGGIGTTTLQPNGYALLVDPKFDPSSAPPGALLLAPQKQASLISLSSTKAQSLALFAPGFSAVVSSYDGSLLPKSGVSLERINPAAADSMGRNWSLSAASGGTPGACNSVTPGEVCDAQPP